MPSILDDLQPPDRPVAWPDLGDPRVKALLADVPGNILKGHGRVFSAMQFVRFTDPAAARRWAADIGAHITTAAQQQEQTERWRAAQAPAATPEALQTAAQDFFVGLYFTASGWAKLGLPLAADASEAFRFGLLKNNHNVERGRAGRKLRDQEGEWEPGYEQELHALLLVAFDEPARAPAEAFFSAAIQRGELERDTQGNLTAPGETGGRLYDEGGVTGRREVEHFGFRDGISQLHFLPPTVPGKSLRRDDLYPLRQVLVPLEQITGRAEDREVCGSFLVWRKLEQQVREFQDGIGKLAAHFGDETERGKERARGWVVGRFRDGTPLALHDDPANRPTNRFDYDLPGDAGPEGGKFCPFHAHVRKMNPRGDHRPNAVPPRNRLPVRRSVPFGRRAMRSTGGRELIVDQLPEVGEKVGLLFMAFVAGIEDQFEHLIQEWANAGHFPWPSPADPLVGRTEEPDVALPRPSGGQMTSFPRCVLPRGGAYLFALPASVFARLRSEL
jgi:deferrochelatase/peroxidase EfeB